MITVNRGDTMRRARSCARASARRMSPVEKTLSSMYSKATAVATARNKPITRCRPRRSEEHTSELQSHSDLVCRLLLEKKKKKKTHITISRTITNERARETHR